MSKKLRGNGLFESSRMMLPEHKEAYIRHLQQAGKTQRPHLDEQQVERISRMLALARQSGQRVTVTVFGEFGKEQIVGQIVKTDALRRTIALDRDGETVWIPVADIADLE